MKKLRKFLNVSVMVMTVLSMCGLGMLTPNFASAAASAGDLIKMEGNSSVYYFDGAKRFVFPNESTYFSWYSDFSGVVTIAASELQSYPLGGNVTMRPGTKLVKITTDPSVYAVEKNGVLRKIQSEAQAASLYGTAWAKRVVDVPDAFFTNYSIGSALSSGSIPAGSLVKAVGSSAVYYYDGTDYRSIASEAAMKANRLSFDNVLTVDLTITASGSAITGMEEALVKTSQGATSGPVITGSGLMVSLNSMTPAAQSVPQTASRVPFTKVNLTAANDGAVNVSSITVKRTGLTANSDKIKVWAEKNGESLSSKRTLSNDEAILVFAPALIVPAGQTISVDILAELDGVTGNGSLSIASASAVSATAASVSGSFPITGNLMSFTSYDVTKLTFKGKATNHYAVKVGDENVELGSFDIEFKNKDRDVSISSIALRNSGTEDLKDVVMNLYLENSGNKVSHNAVLDGRYATFTMLDGAMDMLKDDGTQNFIVKGDIIAKNSISTENSIELKLHRLEDLVANEKSTGFGVMLDSTSVQTVSTIKIEAGNVTLSKKSTSPSGDKTVVANTPGVVVLLANIKADEMIAAEGMTIEYSGKGVGTDSYVDTFSNIRVSLNNVLLDSFDPVMNGSDKTVTDTNTRPIDSAFTLNKGDNEIKITVDVKSNAKVNMEFSASLDADNTTYDFLDMPEYVSNGNTVNEISGKASGAALKTAGALLEVVTNDGYENNRTIVEGTDDISLAKFAAKATNDKVTITGVKLGVNSGTAASTTVANISGMKLFVDGVQIGNTRNFTSNGADFTGLSYEIAQNSTKVFELKGSFSSSAASGTAGTYFKTEATFNAKDSSGKSVDGAKATTTQFKITEGGTLAVAAAASTPNSTILVAMAGVEQEVAQFTLTSTNDSSNVKEIVIKNATSTASDLRTDRVASYKLYDGSILIDTVTPFNHEATFYINNDKLIVPRNGTKDIVIKAVFNDIGVKAQTGGELLVRIVSMEAKSSNGSDISSLSSLNKDANVMIVRKTKPTFAKVSGVTGDAGSQQEMVRFSVTANSNEKLKLTDLAFLFEGNASGTNAIQGKEVKLFEVGDSTAKATTTVIAGTLTATFASLDIEVSGSKVFYVVANTNDMEKDSRLGITLSNTTTNNIKWSEYFVAGYETGGTGLYLNTFPILGGSMTY